MFESEKEKEKTIVSDELMAFSYYIQFHFMERIFDGKNEINIIIALYVNL